MELTKNLYKLASKHYRIKSVRQAALPLAFILLLIVEALSVYISVKFNSWYNGFYNSLQDYNLTQFGASLRDFVYILLSLGLVLTSRYYACEFVKNKWRCVMTREMLDKWLGLKAFYGLQLLQDGRDNPDQRIAEDIKSFTKISTELLVDCFGAILTLASFAVILWNLSVPVPVTLWGNEFMLRGYLLWIAIIYTVFSTWGFGLLNRPLAKLFYKREKLEADFRKRMNIIGQSSDSIALSNGGDFEKRHLFALFDIIYRNEHKSIRLKSAIEFLRNIYKKVSSFLPALLLSPLYFQKLFHIGTLMQANNAFSRLNIALSVLINSYESVAELRSVALRLVELEDSMKQWQMISQQDKLEIANDETVSAHNLRIFLPDGKKLMEDFNLKLSSQSLLLSGGNGQGKTTLFKAFAGLWPYTEGRISIPRGKKILFVPQKPYIPNATLKEVICFPEADTNYQDNICVQLLEDLGISAFSACLHEQKDWAQILSGGEKQLMVFARIIMHKPDIVFLDESTSSLAPDLRKRAFATLKRYLPDLQIVSISHQDHDHIEIKDVVQL
jgi:putative ATP-binding cassette transporter